MTPAPSPSVHPQGQRKPFEAHGHLLDDYEDHVIADIADEAGAPFEEVAELFAS